MNDIPIKLCECGCGERTTPAIKTSTKNGWVKGEPLRYIHGHNRRKSATEYLVDPDTGCWIWLRAIAYARGGYGISYDGQKPRDAHRVFYERHKGPIPAGWHLHHMCHNPPCVNPNHLEPREPVEHARLQRSMKLSMKDARTIRASQETGRALAARYGVSEAHISRIRLGQVWRE